MNEAGQESGASPNPFVVEPAARPVVAICGSDALFPVRRVICIGRNYADHAREMGGDPDREPPFFFMKPGDAVRPASGRVAYPTQTSQLEHEVELVIAIGVAGSEIPVAQALSHVWGYAVGVDLTRRDLQQAAKAARRPWDTAKGFDESAPLTTLVSADQVGELTQGRIWLAVNGVTAQDGDLAEMIWSVPEIISAASQAWALEPGDLIFTGTPAGVGVLERGDVVAGGVEGVGSFTFEVA